MSIQFTQLVEKTYLQKNNAEKEIHISFCNTNRLCQGYFNGLENTSGAREETN